MAGLKHHARRGAVLAAIVTAAAAVFLAGCDNPVLLRLKQLAFQEAYAPWSRAYFGTADDQPRSLDYVEADGGYVVAGSTSSFLPAAAKGWLMYLASDGTITWQKSLLVTSEASGQASEIRSSGDYVYAVGNPSAWILKMDRAGAVLWQRRFDRAAYDQIVLDTLSTTRDGGIVAAGLADPPGATAGGIWVVKISADGAVQWQKLYQLPGYTSNATSIEEAHGGYVLMGSALNISDYDFWILTLDAEGDVLHCRRFDAGTEDAPGSVKPAGNGYIATGTFSSGGTGKMAWAARINPDLASAVWDKRYDSSGDDEATDIEVLPGGGFVVAGKYGGSGFAAWLLGLSDNGSLQWSSAYGTNLLNGFADVHPVGDYGLSAAGQVWYDVGHQLDFFIQVLQADGGPAFTNLGMSSGTDAPVTTGENLVWFYPEVTPAVTSTSLAILTSGLSIANTDASVETFYPAP